MRGKVLNDQIRLSRACLERNLKSNTSLEINIEKQSFSVLPGVFSPRDFDSTEIYAARFPFRKEKAFLEVGCGTGILSVLAALRGAESVVAIDINIKAVENTRLNAARHQITNRLSARQGDVFSPLEPDERFDTIFWNLPFIYVPHNFQFQNVLERSLFDPDYEATERFLANARRFLNSDGRLFVGFADFGDPSLLGQLASKYFFRKRVLSEDEGMEGKPVVFYLIELIAK